MSFGVICWRRVIGKDMLSGAPITWKRRHPGIHSSCLWPYKGVVALLKDRQAGTVMLPVNSLTVPLACRLPAFLSLLLLQCLQRQVTCLIVKEENKVMGMGKGSTGAWNIVVVGSPDISDFHICRQWQECPLPPTNTGKETPVSITQLFRSTILNWSNAGIN